MARADSPTFFLLGLHIVVGMVVMARPLIPRVNPGAGGGGRWHGSA
jgi:hypothetical protein